MAETASPKTQTKVSSPLKEEDKDDDALLRNFVAASGDSPHPQSEKPKKRGRPRKTPLVKKEKEKVPEEQQQAPPIKVVELTTDSDSDLAPLLYTRVVIPRDDDDNEPQVIHIKQEPVIIEPIEVREPEPELEPSVVYVPVPEEKPVRTWQEWLRLIALGLVGTYVGYTILAAYGNYREYMGAKKAVDLVRQRMELQQAEEEFLRRSRADAASSEGGDNKPAKGEVRGTSAGSTAASTPSN